MTTMTDTDIVEALAKREGWRIYQCGKDSVTPHKWRIVPPRPYIMCIERFDTKNKALQWFNYLKSRDALQPILDGLTDSEKAELFKHLHKHHEVTEVVNGYYISSFWWTILNMKPRDLAQLLVKALKLGKEGERYES